MKHIERPSADEYFMEIAQVVAKRSTCLRNKVGALFVKHKRILSTGYNGAPAGLPHCDVLGCAREGMASGTHHELCRAFTQSRTQSFRQLCMASASKEQLFTAPISPVSSAQR